MPKVSVIIPTHNRAAMLKEAMDSVLKQTLKDYEIIVIDANSTDNTEEVLREYKDKIQYNRLADNSLCYETCNIGIDLSKGEYIAILNDDDAWLEKNLELKVDFLERHSATFAVTSDFEDFGDMNNASTFSYRNLFKNYKSEEFIIRNSLNLLLGECFMFGSTTLIRRKAFFKFGNFTTQAGDDYELFLRIALESDIGCINKVLARKRNHGGNFSKHINSNHSSRIFSLSKTLASPLISDKDKSKAIREISKIYFNWSYQLLNNNDLSSARQKALLSFKYRPAIKPLKVFLRSSLNSLNICR